MRSQRLSQVLLAAGVSAFAVGGFAPMMASAASNNDTVTVAGGSSYTYTFNQSPSIQATAQPNCASFSSPGQITLSLSGPGVTSPTLASHRGDCSKAVTLSPSSSSVNTAHPAWAGGSTPADNGVYTVTLDNQGRTKTANFTLLIPPARPNGFSVAPDSASSATFTWNANPEADINGYEITNSAGNVIADPTYQACSSGSCTTGPMDLGSSVAGHTERYSIIALRSCGGAPCSSGHIASTSSAQASGTFPAAPAPSSSPTPTKSGSGGNTGGGNNTGGSSKHNGGGTKLGTLHTSSGGNSGSTVNLGRADSAGQVSHNLAPANVAPLPAVNAPPLPAAALGSGSESLGAPPGKIQYPKPLLAPKSNNSAPKTLYRDIKNGLSAPPLWRGIAAAAVLILIAVHLRAWVARTEAF